MSRGSHSHNTITWTAVRISNDMWNVYRGDDFSGYIHKTSDGWRVDMQRQSRPTAEEAAKDAWGEDAAQALRAAEKIAGMIQMALDSMAITCCPGERTRQNRV